MCRKHFVVGENYVQVKIPRLTINATLRRFLNCLSFPFLVSLKFSSGNGKKIKFIIIYNNYIK